MAKTIAEILQPSWVSELLAGANLARLATCDPLSLQPHVVPVWYEWDGGSIWISSFRSTRKVRELKKNPLVSLVVDMDEPGGPAYGVIFEGKATLITEAAFGIERGLRIYTRYLGAQGALAAEPQSWLHDPEHLIIQLTPSRASTWGK
jgi:hypothetical protein